MYFSSSILSYCKESKEIPVRPSQQLLKKRRRKGQVLETHLGLTLTEGKCPSAKEKKKWQVPQNGPLP